MFVHPRHDSSFDSLHYGMLKYTLLILSQKRLYWLSLMPHFNLSFPFVICEESALIKTSPIFYTV